ncbi:hypothetical protein [Sphingomonas sp. GB1N7]|uniref:hypothetical protein n=1 Tax=Parasphingomonas caseinilytica TaxID=3096158 RepID=UPI002FCBD950
MMSPASVLREFNARQRAILSILDIARQELSYPYIEAWPALVHHQQKIGSAMQRLQRFKHDNIFDPIITRGQSDKGIAEKLKADCVMLGGQYDAFRQKWAKADAGANWPEYRLSAISMMTTIRKSFSEQEAVIKTLALV